MLAVISHNDVEQDIDGVGPLGLSVSEGPFDSDVRVNSASWLLARRRESGP